MTNRIRLTVEQDADDDRDIAALSLDESPHREAVIDQSEVPEFVRDCLGWNLVVNSYTDNDGALVTVTGAHRFNQGFGVVVTIAAEDWERWLEGYEVVEDIDPTHVVAFLS